MSIYSKAKRAGVFASWAAILALLFLLPTIGRKTVIAEDYFPTAVLQDSELTTSLAGDRHWAIPESATPKEKRILHDLILCESRNDEKARNPKDRDGTPSLGLLQFKPSTLYDWVTRYDILPSIEQGEIMNVIWDGQVQIDAFLAAYRASGGTKKWWSQQFPGCSEIYKYWL